MADRSAKDSDVVVGRKQFWKNERGNLVMAVCIVGAIALAAVILWIL